MNTLVASRHLVAAVAVTMLLMACGGGGGDDPAQPQADKKDGTARRMAIAAPAQSVWSPLRTLPLVPVSISNLPDGKVLMWSAEEKFSFGAATGRTYSLTFDPATDTVAERTVTETGHNMFCPGTTNLPDGRLLVNGGISSSRTSIFNPANNTWSTGPAMNIARGYQANTLLKDGSVLTLGGSWSGGTGNKHGEVWTTAGGWVRKTGIPIDPMLSVDSSRAFGMDSHFMLLPAGNGKVFHAGPGVNMHWIGTEGAGSVTSAGARGDDEFSMSGNTVMYEQGKILKTGGGPGYDSVNANANSYVIDINGGVTVRKLNPMAYRRAFHNSVVLPNGQVLIVGGQTLAVGFSDNNSVLVPELFDPATEAFTTLPPIAAPRNYHSVAILLPDARVLSAGGGLCGAGCAANHADLQIWTPHYLRNPDGTPATRPVITAAPATVQYGQRANVATSGAVASFSMVRLSSTTHTVNNDQRRLALTHRSTGTNSYEVDIPTNPGWALPGDWMLFALNADGTPSVAKIVRITLDGAPLFAAIDNQTSTLGAAVSVLPTVTVPGVAAATFEATGLPAGITIDGSTGRLQGTPATAGTSRVTVRATANGVTTSTDFLWTVVVPGSTRFVRLEALSEINGNPWSSAAEINLLGLNGQVLSRTGWVVSADSQELVGESGAVTNAFDGNAATIWHTQWQAASPPPPHWVMINLGGATDVGGLRYLPRSGGGNGTIARYNVYLSADGVNWGAPVASGNFADLAAAATEKTIYFPNLARGRAAMQSSTANGGTAARAVDGSVDGVFANASVSQTSSEVSAWWEVDLGASHALSAVRLWNRTDCCADQLSNFYLLVSDTPMQGRTLGALLADANVWRSQFSGIAPRATLINAAGARGRFVRVQLAGTNALQLAEVEVHGQLAVNRSPAMTQPATQSTVQGNATSLTVSASDPDGDLLTYSAAGLPPGLGIAPGTGVISGTPTAEGSHAVTVTVDDGRGGSTAVQFNWTVTAALPDVLPVLALPVAAGGTVNYTANTSTLGSYSYQWDFGDGTPLTAWSGLNTASHSYATAGIYLVTVSVRTNDGRVSTQNFWQAVSGTMGLGGRSSSPVLFEPRAGQSARVWAVNPDNDSVSVFDAATRTRVAEIPVGTAPRTLALAPDGRVCVVNKGSATISIISPSTLGVVQAISLARASQPYGIVIAADGTAFVTHEATGQLTRVAANGAVGPSTQLGERLRHLALNAAGTQLLVARFVTPALPGEGTASVQTSVAGAPRGAEVMVVDAATLALQRTIVLQHSERADTTAQGRGVPNYLGAPVIAPDGRSAWVPSKQDNIKRGRLRDGLDLDFQNTLRAISSRINLDNQAEDLAARIDHDNSGVASAAVFHPGGAYLFVALESSRHVAVVDAAGHRELFRIDAGRAPQGLAVSADGLTLYVQNFMDRTVGVYDLTRLVNYGESALPLLATMASVGTERLAANVLRGKQFFYDARDPRLARDAYISCAGCHNDGGHDGRTWDFTGFGEGLRNTVSLRGRSGAQGGLHWSANFNEVHDFEGQIRAFAQGTGLMTNAQFNTGTRSQPLGDNKAGVSADLDALAAYVASLSTFDNTPWRNADGSLSAAAVAGRTVFAAQCSSCHGGTDFTDSAAGTLRNVGTIKPSSGTRLGTALTGIDSPTLRDAWATAPYLHDGSAPTLQAAISAHNTFTLNATDLANVSEFVRQIGREEAAVAPPPPATGLRGDYFAGVGVAGTPLLTRYEAIDFNWGTAAPATAVPADHFSVRWSGFVTPTATGSYRFRTVSDDGVRVWVNGQLVINNWTDHAATTNTSGNVSLTAGQRYAVTVEYYERTGGATMRWLWRLPGTTSYVAVPPSALTPQ